MFSLYTDGGARGNPGPAGAGIVLLDAQNTTIAEATEYLGVCTNNEAEYKALLLGLRTAHSSKVKDLTCYLDSELVVKQLTGEYRVKNSNLKDLYTQVKKLESVFDQLTYLHVTRNKNDRADYLVNKVLDEHA